MRTSSGVKVRPSMKSSTRMPGSACTTPGLKPAKCAARLAAKLVRAHDAMNEDVVADAHDVAASAILDH